MVFKLITDSRNCKNRTRVSGECMHPDNWKPGGPSWKETTARLKKVKQKILDDVKGQHWNSVKEHIDEYIRIERRYWKEYNKTKSPSCAKKICPIHNQYRGGKGKFDYEMGLHIEIDQPNDNGDCHKERD